MQDNELEPNRALYANPQVYAEGWYVAARSKELKGKPLRRTMVGRELVVFRDGSGKPHVLSGRCSHMGALLADGRIVGDCIECPFHAFRYDAAGNCVRMPSDAEKAPRFKLPSFVTEERWGQIWFYLGGEPAYSLDVFNEVGTMDHLFFPRGTFVPHQHVMIPNALDVTHFRSVHGMDVEKFEVESGPLHMRSEMIFHVSKQAPLVFRALGFKRLSLTFETWGGNNYLVRMLSPVRFSFLTSYCQRNEGGTLSATIACFPKFSAWKKLTGFWLVEAFLKMKCISDFFADDERWINNIQFAPRFISSDKYYVEFMKLCNRLKPYKPAGQPGSGGDERP